MGSQLGIPCPWRWLKALNGLMQLANMRKNVMMNKARSVEVCYVIVLKSFVCELVLGELNLSHCELVFSFRFRGQERAIDECIGCGDREPNGFP